MACDFEHIEADLYRCRLCRREMRGRPPLRANCRAPTEEAQQGARHRPAPRQRGPGTELKLLLAEIGISEGNCACAARAAQMNHWGNNGCRQHRHEIAGQLRDAASARGWTAKLAAAATAVAKRKWSLLTSDPYLALVDAAIAAAEERAKPREIKTRHLIYHLWPVAATETWRWNTDQLARRIEQFNGRRVVAVALDDLTVSCAEVRRAFAGHDVELLERANDPRLREAATFIELLESVQTDDPTHATFYAHAKGSSRRGSVLGPVRAWTERMYRELLDDPRRAADALATHAMLGCHFPCEPRWQYPGTFWWFHNATVFETEAWRKLENPVGNEGPGWAVEAFPDRMFARSDCAEITCEAIDAAPGEKFSLYAPEVWGLGRSPTVDEGLAAFDNDVYLAANPDVAAAVAQGVYADGRAHYAAFGHAESRPPN